MFLLLCISFIYKNTNCFLLVADFYCIFIPKNILMKITCSQVTVEFVLPTTFYIYRWNISRIYFTSKIEVFPVKYSRIYCTGEKTAGFI